MADESKVTELLRLLASQGFNAGDIMKGLKELKASGVIKAKKGKVPVSDPIRNAIRDLLLASNIKVNDVDTSVMAAVISSVGEAKSYMVTLDKDWSLNFVKRVARVSKKKDKTAEPKLAEAETSGNSKDMSEPTITL